GLPVAGFTVMSQRPRNALVSCAKAVEASAIVRIEANRIFILTRVSVSFSTQPCHLLLSFSLRASKTMVFSPFEQTDPSANLSFRKLLADRSCYCFEARDRPDRLGIALFGNRGTA